MKNFKLMLMAVTAFSVALFAAEGDVPGVNAGGSVSKSKASDDSSYVLDEARVMRDEFWKSFGQVLTTMKNNVVEYVDVTSYSKGTESDHALDIQDGAGATRETIWKPLGQAATTMKNDVVNHVDATAYPKGTESDHRLDVLDGKGATRETIWKPLGQAATKTGDKIVKYLDATTYPKGTESDHALDVLDGAGATRDMLWKPLIPFAQAVTMGLLFCSQWLAQGHPDNDSECKNIEELPKAGIWVTGKINNFVADYNKRVAESKLAKQKKIDDKEVARLAQIKADEAQKSISEDSSLLGRAKQSISSISNFVRGNFYAIGAVGLVTAGVVTTYVYRQYHADEDQDEEEYN